MAGQGSSSSSTAPVRLIEPIHEVSKSAGTVTDSAVQHPPVKIDSHFRQSQLALALSIVKSKPDHLSTIEYCQQLQKRIKPDRSTPDDEHRYVDTAEFWKDQCTRFHRENKGLEDKVDRLEEELRILRQSTSQNGSLDAVPHQLGLLQQPGLVDQHIDGGTSRKRRAEDTVGDRDSPFEPASPADDNQLRLSSYIFRIGRQRTRLEKTSKLAKSVAQIDDLASKSIQLLRLLENALSDCCLPLSLLKTNDENKHCLAIFQQVVNQISLSFQSSFDALNELCRTIPGRSKRLEIIHRMVTFFRTALDLLHTVSSLQAEHEANHNNRGLRRKHCRQEEGEYAVNKFVANTLASTAYGLEWKIHQPGHCDLLEGILFSILEHTGRLLSEATFGEYVATSKNTGKITESNDIPPTGRVLEYESRYMVQVLHAALGGRDRKELVARVLAAGKTNLNAQKRRGGSGISALSSDLLSKVNMLVQNTLLKCTIGGSKFETLKLPTPPPPEDSTPPVETPGVEPYGSDWLVETMWALVGWDFVA